MLLSWKCSSNRSGQKGCRRFIGMFIKRSRWLFFLLRDFFVAEVVISFDRRFVFVSGESFRRGTYHL